MATKLETNKTNDIFISDEMQIEELEKYIKECNHSMKFDESINQIQNLILSACDDTTVKMIHSLSIAEQEDHSPEVQDELSNVLLQAANVLHKMQFPHSPACQWMMETYRSPALLWAIKAVEQNYIPAYNTERIIVLDGAKDVSPNVQLARALAFVGAKRNNIQAQEALAFEYELDDAGFNMKRLVEFNLSKSQFWYSKIEESSDPDRHEILAKHYKFSDPQKALLHYEKLLGLKKENSKYYPDLIYCLCMLGRIPECKKYIGYVTQSEKAEVCFETYRTLNNANCSSSAPENKINGLEAIDDITLEMALLKHASAFNHKQATIMLAERYRRSIFGKVKRTKAWGKYI